MAFATAEDIATRLGRDLSSEEGAKAELLLDTATAVIAAACDKTDAWASALSPVPNLLKLMAVELAVRAFNATSGLRAKSEQLGQYQSSESYAADAAGVMLTATEELLVRRVVFGSNSGSAKTDSLATDVYDYLYS